jgi:hypothetical protein
MPEAAGILDGGAAPSAGLVDRFMERLDPIGEYLNPILVKEVRQALRSKRFMAAFMLALVASLAVTLIVLIPSITDEVSSQAGKIVFTGLFICYAIIAMVVVPFEVQARHVADRTHAEVDLVQITRLSAYRILSGKLQAALVTLVLYLSALVPFSTFSYLLKGVTPAMILIGFLLAVVGGVTAINFVLFASTFVKDKRAMGGTIFLCLLGALSVISAGISLVQQFSGGSFAPANFWLVLGMAAAGTVALNAVLFTTTASRMSFPSANKETGPRLALFGMNLYLVAVVFSVWAISGYDREAVLAMTISALAWWALVGYFVLGVPIETNERIRNSAPRRALPGFLFWPGRGRAYAYYILNLLLLCVPAAVAFLGSASVGEESSMAAISTALYAASFPGIPAVLFAFMQRKWGRPRRLVRATGVFIVAYFVAHLVVFLAVLAIMAASSRGSPDMQDLAPLHAFSPPFGVGFLFDTGKSAQFLWNVAVGGIALIVTLAHFAPLAARDLVESVRLAAARRRGELDEALRPPEPPPEAASAGEPGRSASA